MGTFYPYTTRSGETLYRIVYRRPDNTQTSERGFTTKKAAKGRLAEVTVSKAKGDYIDPSDAKVTVASLGATWLKNRESVMKPSSYRPVESAWRIHVRDKWGRRHVGSLRHSEVQSWVSELSKSLSATTVLRAHGVLAAILDVAVKDRRVTRNVARDLSLPRKRATGKTFLSHEQVGTLAEASKYPVLVLFLAYTGLRWGEATALRVKHVDAVRRRVSVEENAVMVGSYVELGTPKTHEVRSVPYPEFLTEAIAEGMKGKRPAGLLFGEGRTHLRLPNSRDGWFAAAVKRVQLGDEDFPRVTPHDLRHTAASLAISAGANVKAVQRMLGHASAAMTLDVYGDLFDDDLDDVAAALNQAHTKRIVANMLSPTDSGE